jgi:hypothetical protein
MENQYLSLQLLRNIYKVNEGESIVNQLIADKINFLKKQIFKLEERQGIQSPFLENRLEELNQNIVQLRDFINGIDDKNQEMLINCSIKIHLVPAKNAKNGNLINKHGLKSVN